MQRCVKSYLKMTPMIPYNTAHIGVTKHSFGTLILTGQKADSLSASTENWSHKERRKYWLNYMEFFIQNL